MSRLETGKSATPTPWLSRIVTLGTGSEIAGLLMLLAVVVLVFSLATDRFLTVPTFTSVAFQLPELGLLTLAMLIPILSGGLNLAITFTANICGLVLAWVLQANGGVEAGMFAFLIGGLAAVAVGAFIGWVMGAAIAYTGAHPILVSLSMMIFLRGLGEFLTRGGDISGFPQFVGSLGHGWFAGIPVPLWILIACVALWHLILNRTRLGLTTYMAGSNIEATRYSGIDTKRTIMLVYTLSGVMCGIAGILMLARFNSVRVGHGEAYLLITVLACFLGRVDPFGGFGRALPVALALLILQVISSGLNLLGANQHLATAMWGAFLIVVMVVRHVWAGRSVRRT
jgi:simple sugar transport system permease protein